MKSTICFLITAMVVPLVTPLSSRGQATYEIEFIATWSNATHPGAYPGGAHFSRLIGATHDPSFSLWEVGGLASPGIEQMAETGGTSLLRNQINSTLGSDHLLSGFNINSPGSTAFEFDIFAESSHVTLVTMVAPSPDWFVGVSGLDLRAGGSWTESLSVELFAYDAGTDSGPNFTSGNQDTNPQESIALLGSPLAGYPALGTFTFTRLSVPEPDGQVLGFGCALLVVLALRKSARG